MKVKEIKTAVEQGKPVRWKSSAYHIVKDNLGQFLIVYQGTGKSTIGLTWNDGRTLNGRGEDFYIENE